MNQLDQSNLNQSNLNQSNLNQSDQNRIPLNVINLNGNLIPLEINNFNPIQQIQQIQPEPDQYLVRPIYHNYQYDPTYGLHATKKQRLG